MLNLSKPKLLLLLRLIGRKTTAAQIDNRRLIDRITINILFRSVDVAHSTNQKVFFLFFRSGGTAKHALPTVFREKINPRGTPFNTIYSGTEISPARISTSADTKSH